MNFKFKSGYQFFCYFFLLFLIIFISFSPISLAANLDEGKTIFQSNCAGCHAHGGNIIRRGKSLKKRALKRNGYESIADVYQIVTQGKGNMSAYAERLTPEEIDIVSRYVLQQAEQGWK